MSDHHGHHHLGHPHHHHHNHRHTHDHHHHDLDLGERDLGTVVLDVGGEHHHGGHHEHHVGDALDLPPVSFVGPADKLFH